MEQSEAYIPTGDGVDIWTAISGSGPPLVLCHGGPGLWDDLRPVAKMVDDLYTVYRFDQRGGGRSSRTGPYTLDRFVADLEVLRAHFGHETWVVGGHSWGATLALAYAWQHPRRVRALLYLSGTGLGQGWKETYRKEREARLRACGAAAWQRFQELSGKERTNAEEREYCRLSWSTDFANREQALEHASRLVDPWFPPNYECNRALNAEVGAWDEDALKEKCHRLDLPVLVLDGEEDARPGWAVDSLVGTLPQCQRVVMPGTGHIPWMEDPDSFRDALRLFLSCHADAP